MECKFKIGDILNGVENVEKGTHFFVRIVLEIIKLSSDKKVVLKTLAFYRDKVSIETNNYSPEYYKKEKDNIWLYDLFCDLQQ